MFWIEPKSVKVRFPCYNHFKTFILPPNHTGPTYDQVLGVFYGCSAKTLWMIQHDGASPHFTDAAGQYLDLRFGQRWISRGGTIGWSTATAGFNSIGGIFLCGVVLKVWFTGLVYKQRKVCWEELMSQLNRLKRHQEWSSKLTENDS